MNIFSLSDGTIVDVRPVNTYQGSSLSGKISFFAPFAKQNAVTVKFILPNGEITPPFAMSFAGALKDVLTADKRQYNRWEWDIQLPVTQHAGLVRMQFDIFIYDEFGRKHTTATASTQFNVSEGVPPLLPDEPSGDAWDALVVMYQQLASRTAGIGGALVGTVATGTNSFAGVTYDGLRTADTYLPGINGGQVAYTKMATWNGTIYTNAWQASYVGDQILFYRYTVAAATHGQAVDGADPKFFRIGATGDSDGTTENMSISWYVNENGDVEFRINQPMDTHVTIWNGRGIQGEQGIQGVPGEGMDVTAREMAQEALDISGNLIVVDSQEPDIKVSNQLWLQEVS